MMRPPGPPRARMEEPRSSAPGPMVVKENPRGPTIIGFSLPQLLNRVNSIMPSVEEVIMPKVERVMEVENVRNPFKEFRDFETLNFGFPRPQEGIFGRKDDDLEPFGFEGLFDQVNSQMSRLMNSLPEQFGQGRSWNPFSDQPSDVGQLTIVKAGPGFHEEKHYDIGPNGKLTEITEAPISQEHDALEHENPMDIHFNSNDVEIFGDSFENFFNNNEEEEPTTEQEPVMDVRGIEDHESSVPEEAEKVEKVSDFSSKQEQEYPFLSVLRNTVEENERLSEELLQKYRIMTENQYTDDNTCSNHHQKWSDWVACLHQRVGVPRWLTAATISLGIVFSVWLCLVIPSSAPKQRLRTLVIKTEKPSATLAKAKEAEASASKGKEDEE